MFSIMPLQNPSTLNEKICWKLWSSVIFKISIFLIERQDNKW